MLLTILLKQKNPENIKLKNFANQKKQTFKEQKAKEEDLVKEVSRIETCKTINKQRQLVEQVFLQQQTNHFQIAKLFSSRKQAS